jgi:hypothetical protein
MQETLRHQEAFELYYKLGPKRSYAKVGQQIGISKTSIDKWGRNFNWGKRVKKRDKEMAEKIIKKNNRVILKTKEEYHKEVQDSISLIRGALIIMAEKIRSKTFKAETAQDLSTLIRAQDAAIRLEQLLAGEADSREGRIVNINILPCEPVARPVQSKEIENG